MPITILRNCLNSFHQPTPDDKDQGKPRFKRKDHIPIHTHGPYFLCWGQGYKLQNWGINLLQTGRDSDSVGPNLTNQFYPQIYDNWYCNMRIGPYISLV
jgi:hypothetical protein